MYEIFEHTADMGIRVRADSLEELFADAARGLFSVMVENIDAVRAVEETTFRLHGEDIEELLHDWLAELLFTFHARRIVFTEFHVRFDPPELTATARGEPIDLGRHKLDAEVKAITWCGLKVEHNADGWLAEVIVDI
jgi:SHS2 domain-containing protein